MTYLEHREKHLEEQREWITKCGGNLQYLFVAGGQPFLKIFEAY